MFLRSHDGTTLTQVREALDEHGETISALSSEIAVNLTGDAPSFRVKDREVPVTTRGLKALAGRYEIPYKFLERNEADIQEFNLQRVIERNAKANAVVISDEGILEVRPQEVPQVDVRRIVDVAAHVIGTTDAPVVDWFREPGRESRLDVAVPEGYDRGWGGDRRVNDLTGTGLRFGQDLRQTGQFHSPTVSLLLYRLACTNGYENVDEQARLDARGANSVDEVIAELEALAQRLFARGEDKIAAFYEMRNTQVENPEQRIVRLASESGISNRIALDMVARVPEYNIEGSHWTEFDIVNLVTNEANNPTISRDNARRQLHQVGGTMIDEHSARCSHCQSKLN